MSKKPRNKFIEEVKIALWDRSNGLCEVCGTEMVTDNDHILEFSKGGADSLDNLIQLCPNCHRQIPKYLSYEQRKFLQQQLCHLNSEDTHKFVLKDKTIKIGAFSFRGSNNLVQIDNINVIYLSEKEIRSDTKEIAKSCLDYYVHIVMLDNFNPQLLILGNRIIYGETDSQKIDFHRSKNFVSLKINEIEIFNMSEENDIISLKTIFKYKNKAFEFVNNTKIPFGGGNIIFKDCGGSGFANGLVIS